MSNKWNKYPEVEPPSAGKYLALVSYGGDRWIDVELYGWAAACDDSGAFQLNKAAWILGQKLHGTKVIGWAEIPEGYRNLVEED